MTSIMPIITYPILWVCVVSVGPSCESSLRGGQTHYRFRFLLGSVVVTASGE
jgi:hypothetical protein